MQEKSNVKPRNSKTKIIPPKGKKSENLSRDEVRFINKKRIRRKRRLKRLMGLLLCAVLFVGLALVLVLTVFFKTEKIEITGAKVYSEKEILAKSNIEIGDNLFMVNEDDLNRKLPKSLPFISSVEIDRKLPDTLVIKVNGTKAVAAVESGTGFILIDDTGKILDKNASMLNEGVAIISGVALKNTAEGERVKLKNEALTATLISALKSIKDNDFKLITEIIIEKSGELSLRYDDRIKVKLGSTANIDKKIARAKAAIDKENEINPYTEGVLDLKTEPYAYFSAGKEEQATKPVVSETVKDTVTETVKEN